MGAKTRTQLITAGLAKVGRSDLSTLAVDWLNDWLRGEYAAWPFPFLQRRVEGVALAQGATSLLLGAGSNGVTEEIQRILDPVWLYTSDYGTQRKVRIRQLVDGSLQTDETTNNPSTNVGTPEYLKIRADSSTWGKWKLIPSSVPDKAYLLAVDYIIMPAALSADASIPLYPDDALMQQVVTMNALQWMNKYREYELLRAIVEDGAAKNRVKFDQQHGTNSHINLDSSVFR